jgi:hypothetical protein
MNYLGYEEINSDINISLSEIEIKWWLDNLAKLRKNTISKPEIYIDKYFKETQSCNFIDRKNEASKLIGEIRNATWDMYIKDEFKFYKQAIHLLLNKKSLENILIELVDINKIKEIHDKKSENEILNVIKSIFGDFSSSVFPYFYELAKSVTQSRRSRAGSTFEIIIQQLMFKFNYQYQNKQSLGSNLFKQKGLGKIVDGIIPNIESYEQKRQKCLVITMKTTLRERWQQVVEEIERTKIPSIHLLTLDQDISDNLLSTLKNHNITLVAHEQTQRKNSKHNNIISFESFFNREIPHVLEYWNHEKCIK